MSTIRAGNISYATDWNYNLGINVPNKGKKMFDIEKPYSVCVDYDTQTFKTEAEAVAFAKNKAQKYEEDVAIKKIISVVKFPVPDYEVVAVG